MTMKQKKTLRIIWHMLPMILLPGCMILTGCAGEETELLIAAEAEEPREAEAAYSSPAPSGIPEKTVSRTEEVQAVDTPVPQEIYVDVCGAVNTPGVYALEEGSRVFQAIEKAGGLNGEAAGEYVNRAQALCDGQQIYIPTREEAESRELSKGAFVQENSERADSGTVSQENARVNLNTADARTLMSLSGIGESKAQAILAYREEHGGFSSIEELMNVQGIKEGTFTKIKENIAVE